MPGCVAGLPLCPRQDGENWLMQWERGDGPATSLAGAQLPSPASARFTGFFGVERQLWWCCVCRGAVPSPPQGPCCCAFQAAAFSSAGLAGSPAWPALPLSPGQLPAAGCSSWLPQGWLLTPSHLQVHSWSREVSGCSKDVALMYDLQAVPGPQEICESGARHR